MINETTSNETIGYWFASEPKLPNGDGRPIVIGEMLRVGPPLKLCRHGLHGSEDPFDALAYAPGPLLYKCRYSGQILRDHDKLCASECTPLAVVDLTDVLRLFARRQALSVINLWTPPDVVRRYLETGDENIRPAAGAAAARAAAWDAAKVAAWDAAKAAARASARAAAKAAAWDAAKAAARDAAGAAAWDAAGDAAWDAVKAAAWDAAWDAAKAAAGDAAEAAAWDAAKQMFKELVDQVFSK